LFRREQHSDYEDHTSDATLAIPVGNYVSADLGNYVSDNRLNLGNYVSADMFTTIEVARVLHLSRTTVYTLINDGSIRPVHIGRSCRITRAELDRFVGGLDAA